jgi:hypothetical protein
VRGHALQFGWGYSDDRQVMTAETDAIDTACEAARRALIEDLRKDQARLDYLEKNPFDNLETIEWRLKNWDDPTVRASIDFMIAHENKAQRSQESR